MIASPFLHSGFAALFTTAWANRSLRLFPTLLSVSSLRRLRAAFPRGAVRSRPSCVPFRPASPTAKAADGSQCWNSAEGLPAHLTSKYRPTTPIRIVGACLLCLCQFAAALAAARFPAPDMRRLVNNRETADDTRF